VAGFGNVISGNGLYGVYAHNSANDFAIAQNIIGLDAAGSVGRPNGVGVFATGVSNFAVGSSVAGLGNVISGNSNDGVDLRGTSNNLSIMANKIGTDITGVGVIGNGGDGVSASNDVSNAVIGGTGARPNLIVGNTGAGISITGSATGVTVAENSIDGNGGLGIDLGTAGVTPNDLLDLDGGPNSLQNFPSITGVTQGGGNTTVDGALTSEIGSAYRIDVYSSPTCDPSLSGEGRTHRGSFAVVTNGAGLAAFSNPVAGATPSTHAITLTATAVSTGSTSEFSACFIVP